MIHVSPQDIKTCGPSSRLTQSPAPPVLMADNDGVATGLVVLVTFNFKSTMFYLFQFLNWFILSRPLSFHGGIFTIYLFICSMVYDLKTSEIHCKKTEKIIVIDMITHI